MSAEGSSITTVVGPPPGLATVRVPSNAASRRCTVQPAAEADLGAADPVADDHVQTFVLVRDLDPGGGRGGCLTTLARLATAKYAADSTGAGGRPGRSMSTSTLSRQAIAAARTAVQPAVGEDRRVNAADQVAQLGQCLAGGLASLGEQLLRGGRVAVHQGLGHAQVHAEGGQPGLRTVVQVTLDPAQLGGLGVDRLGAGLGQLLHPQREPGALCRAEQGPGQQRVRPHQLRPDLEPEQEEAERDRPDGERCDRVDVDEAEQLVEDAGRRHPDQERIDQVEDRAEEARPRAGSA